MQNIITMRIPHIKMHFSAFIKEQTPSAFRQICLLEASAASRRPTALAKHPASALITDKMETLIERHKAAHIFVHHHAVRISHLQPMTFNELKVCINFKFFR